MVNRYPLWKNLLILAVTLYGFIYATPNFFPDQPAIQISRERSGELVTDGVVTQLGTALDAAGIGHQAAERLDNGSVMIRLQQRDQQLPAKAVIDQSLGEGHVVALNLAPTTPQWLLAIGAKAMKLGLDLSGGVHFLMEVDTQAAIKQRQEIYVAELRQRLREEKLRYRQLEPQVDGRLRLHFNTAEERTKAAEWVRGQYREFAVAEGGEGERLFLDLRLTEAKVKEIADYAMEQNLTTLRNRVNELGVAEPLVQRQGSNRIVVELPGVQDTAQAKRTLGKTANLEFRLEARDPAKGEQFAFRDERLGEARLERDVVTTGDSVSNAQSSYDENGRPQVNIDLDSRGGKRMLDATRENVGRRLGVLFIEQKVRMVERERDGQRVREPVRVNERKIISLATIQSPLGNSFRVTGLDSPQEAAELALLLRAGALAAPMVFVEERTVGPSLGQENIRLGTRSALIGIALVMLFMVLVYKLFGLIANVALMVNLALLVAVMSLISATLTLPGIAGIVLAMGMAVDANVLIFGRIREELKNGMSPQAAISAGFDRAFLTILDSNLTTLIATFILYLIGTGPVKGFAITLSIGIIVSMFTAVTGSRALINLIYGGRKVKKLLI
ncbi:MAG: protein translocase subunit SecD [Pseudomonadales bacterium]|nr:protein translocase subunit SecD [Pseudomonadales bacterium]